MRDYVKSRISSINDSSLSRSSHQSWSIKKVFLKISRHLQESTCARVSLLIRSQLHLRKTLAQVLSSYFSEIFKNTFSAEHLRMTACMYCWTLKIAGVKGISHRNSNKLLSKPLFQVIFCLRMLNWCDLSTKDSQYPRYMLLLWK